MDRQTSTQIIGISEFTSKPKYPVILHQIKLVDIVRHLLFYTAEDKSVFTSLGMTLFILFNAYNFKTCYLMCNLIFGRQLVRI